MQHCLSDSDPDYDIFDDTSSEDEIQNVEVENESKEEISEEENNEALRSETENQNDDARSVRHYIGKDKKNSMAKGTKI